VGLWLSAKIGGSIRKKQRNLEEGEPKELGITVGAILTLLAVIIGFSFLMAVSRYDQRKNYEEAEANAIGTEYVLSFAKILSGCDFNRIRHCPSQARRDSTRIRLDFARSETLACMETPRVAPGLERDRARNLH
jgi:hypothetical protein